MSKNKTLEKRLRISVLGMSMVITGTDVIANSPAYVTRSGAPSYQELQAVAEEAALDESTIHGSNPSRTLEALNASEATEDTALEAAAPIEAPELPEPISSYDGYPQSLPDSLGSDYDDVLPTL